MFLDEIGDLPAAAQIKLLRVLQEREITRVGGTQSIRINVRLITATHRDLAVEVRDGRFREDLFFRIHVVPIHLPPLRERPEDVEPLAVSFLERFAAELGRATRTLTPEGLQRLRSHRWPGNVRELQNLAERLLVLGDDGPIGADELAGLLRDAPAQPAAPTAAGPVIEGSLTWEQEHGLLVQGARSAPASQPDRARRSAAQDQPGTIAHAHAALRVARLNPRRTSNRATCRASGCGMTARRSSQRWASCPA